MSELDLPALPVVDEKFWEKVGESTVTAQPPTRVKSAITDNGDALGNLVERSIDTANETFDLRPEDEDDPEIRMKIISAKKDLAMGIINAALKADENRFRKEKKDLLDKLFERIESEKKKIITIDQKQSIESEK